MVYFVGNKLFLICKSHVTAHGPQSIFGDSREINKKKIKNSEGFSLLKINAKN